MRPDAYSLSPELGEQGRNREFFQGSKAAAPWRGGRNGNNDQ
jgi:hypothetical protein